VLIWRTQLTYAIKLFLDSKIDSKINNRRDSKLNFECFVD
jgi:hypothetical protein